MNWEQISRVGVSLAAHGQANKGWAALISVTLQPPGIQLKMANDTFLIYFSQEVTSPLFVPCNR